MNLFTIKLNKNINIQINDLFSIKTDAIEYFYNKLYNKLINNNLLIDLELKYNKYFFLIKFILRLSVNNNDKYLLLYSDENYIKDLNNINLSKNIIDKIYIPLYLNNDDIFDDIISYKIKNLIILDPLLCYKFKDFHKLYYKI